jgi:hypothetical protein
MRLSLTLVDIQNNHHISPSQHKAARTMSTLPILPPALSRQAYGELCELIPPPADDTPEARAQRLDAAMEAVAALHPADAFEAKLAAQACHRA